MTDSSGLVYSLGSGRYISVDLANGPNIQTECEFQIEDDESVTIVDIRHFPSENERRK